jgi:hypothetical protein
MLKNGKIIYLRKNLKIMDKKDVSKVEVAAVVDYFYKNGFSKEQTIGFLIDNVEEYAQFGDKPLNDDEKEKLKNRIEEL